MQKPSIAFHKIAIFLNRMARLDSYKNVLNAINTIYRNPQKGLSVVEGESISITAYEEGVLSIKLSNGLGKTLRKYDLSYKLTFLFKDGKIRINSPDFEAKTNGFL
ncbi:hypothetical protein [Pedobacter sp. MC2016-24]|uniref:hypothetical protein n=1 Tax=Pedobacter sp. MC2016-24 TaxID=2780090 RepID=UPI0018826BF4|nr:hypothetical protein [Pedobacter sp. MC2016-24]MBE9601990.1 hypothetical protein [Pedobacter sp. MC2016-24]